MKNWPVLIIATTLAIVGIDALIGPEDILGSYPQQAIFGTFGRLPVGISMLVASALMIKDVYRPKERQVGLFLGFMASVFWAVATVTPLFIESNPVNDVRIFGIVFEGPIDSVATLAWMAITALLVYYYFKAKNLLN